MSIVEKNTAYTRRQEVADLANELDETSLKAQLGWSKEFRGYMVQLSVIGAALFGIASIPSVENIKILYIIGSIFLSGSVVLALASSLDQLENTSIEVNETNNKAQKKLRKAMNVWQEVMGDIRSHEDAEKELDRIYTDGIREDNLDPPMKRSWTSIFFFLLFSLGFMFIVLSLILGALQAS